MSLSFEIFTASRASTDALWDVVGDPRRLPEWTDADAVERVDPEPLDVGSEIVTVDGDRRIAWRVVTAENKLIEAETRLGGDRVGVGIRVVRDPLGSRLILAGLVEPAGSQWRARMFTIPRLRGRFDRWSGAALTAVR